MTLGLRTPRTLHLSRSAPGMANAGRDLGLAGRRGVKHTTQVVGAGLTTRRLHTTMSLVMAALTHMPVLLHTESNTLRPAQAHNACTALSTRSSRDMRAPIVSMLLGPQAPASSMPRQHLSLSPGGQMYTTACRHFSQRQPDNTQPANTPTVSLTGIRA